MAAVPTSSQGSLDDEPTRDCHAQNLHLSTDVGVSADGYLARQVNACAVDRGRYYGLYVDASCLGPHHGCVAAETILLECATVVDRDLYVFLGPRLGRGGMLVVDVSICSSLHA